MGGSLRRSRPQRMGGTKPQKKQFRAETEERDAEEGKQRQTDYNGEASNYQSERVHRN